MHLCARGAWGVPWGGSRLTAPGCSSPSLSQPEAKPGNGKAKDKDKPAEPKRKYMGGGIATEY